MGAPMRKPDSELDPIDDIIIRSRRLASAIVCFAAVATFIILSILGVFG